MSRRDVSWIPSAIAAVLLALPAFAQTIQPRIVNGLPTTDYPTTGALLLGSDASSASSWCSGTLIGCSTFLTAAHCVCNTTGDQCQPPNAPDPANYKVYLQHAGLFSVSSIALRSDFAFPVGDVAIVRLASPVAGIAPTPINKTQAPAFGTAGTIVGFGRSSGNLFDYGLKRFGAIVTGACPLSVSPTTSVCWTFDAPIGPPGTDSNTCNADSGGPLFIDFGAGPVLAGSTSGGTGSNCLPTDQSFDANLFPYRAWIQSTAGADLANTSCGALPQVDAAGTTVVDASGTVSSTTPEGRSSFDVAAGQSVLRVTMNAIDDGIADFNLYVKQGTAPTPTSFDCARSGTGQFAACEFASPAAGTWHTLVERVSGSGAYQVTATSFGSAGLTVVLSTAMSSVSPGGVIPLTIGLANHTGSQQSFALSVVLIPPDGSQISLIQASGLAIPGDTTVAPQVQIPLPAAAPHGTWGFGAVLSQSGAVTDQSFLSFQVQ